MTISEESMQKKLKKMNKSQIDIWNGFIEATKAYDTPSGISSSKLAKLLMLDPGNIQRRLNKFVLLGLVIKENSDYIFHSDNIINIFPYIPQDYRINHENFKIERINSFLKESLKITIEQKVENILTELKEIIDQESYKKKKFNDLSYEWLDKPVDEIENVEIEEIQPHYPPANKTRTYRGNIPLFEDQFQEIDKVDVEKDE